MLPGAPVPQPLMPVPLQSAAEQSWPPGCYQPPAAAAASACVPLQPPALPALRLPVQLRQHPGPAAAPPAGSAGRLSAGLLFACAPVAHRIDQGLNSRLFRRQKMLLWVHPCQLPVRRDSSHPEALACCAGLYSSFTSAARSSSCSCVLWRVASASWPCRAAVCALWVLCVQASISRPQQVSARGGSSLGSGAPARHQPACAQPAGLLSARLPRP